MNRNLAKQIGKTEMKKEYEAPKAEKMEFNYEETVTASEIVADETSNDPNGQYFKCKCTVYYSPGWGQSC